VEPACSNIAVQRTVDNHTCYMNRVRAKFKMDSEIFEHWSPSSAIDFKTPTQYPNVGDYKGQIGLSPPTAYPSTMGYCHIYRFPCTWHHTYVPRNYLYPLGPWPYGSIGKEYRQTQRKNKSPPQPNPTSTHTNHMNVEERWWTCQDHSIQTID
jgi:hypothetical protein